MTNVLSYLAQQPMGNLFSFGKLPNHYVLTHSSFLLAFTCSFFPSFLCLSFSLPLLVQLISFNQIMRLGPSMQLSSRCFPFLIRIFLFYVFMFFDRASRYNLVNKANLVHNFSYLLTYSMEQSPS